MDEPNPRALAAIVRTKPFVVGGWRGQRESLGLRHGINGLTFSKDQQGGREREGGVF